MNRTSVAGLVAAFFVSGTLSVHAVGPTTRVTIEGAGLVATDAARPIQQVPETTPQTPAATADELFAAHTQGRFERIEAFYTPGATVSLMQSGRVSTLTVKDYLAWYQGQYASRTSMKFIVGQTSVNVQGNIAAVWVPLEVQEVMKDGKEVTFRATASLQMFRENGVWRISGHAWQAAAN